MTDFSTLLSQGDAWLFIPSAILLGALHGLEPGHSKTMMAAFIVAVRGTVVQAVLLGLAATVSHTAIVWAIALGGMYFGQHWSAEASEPWMQLVSAVLVIGLAAWMLWRTSRNEAACFHDHGSGAAHGDHDHDDHDHADHGHAPARASGHVHGAACGHDHGHAHHDHAHHAHAPATIVPPMDAHERMHAEQIRNNFTDRKVTTGQIVMFGLTGGLIPCPSSITVLILCLQLKRIALGATLVLGFSIGLALTMVASGVIAALGVRHLSQRLQGPGRFGELARKAPYFSGVLMLLVGVYVGWQGLHGLGVA
jgi:ABC-type nickel/cobalt efflux system permease component RcnA